MNDQKQKKRLFGRKKEPADNSMPPLDTDDSIPDRGGHGHGGNDDKERLNSYIAVGKGLKSGKLESEDFHTATMAAVVLRALGVCQSGSCDFPVPEGYFA